MYQQDLEERKYWSRKVLQKSCNFEVCCQQRGKYIISLINKSLYFCLLHLRDDLMVM